MTEKSPAMPFYGRDFYDDERVFLLDFAAQGLYIALLWMQWTEGSIPKDLSKIAILTGQKRVIVARLWPSISKFFTDSIEDTNRLKNQRLEKVRVEMISKRNRRSVAGQKGNDMRWNTSSIDGSQCDRIAIATSSPAVAVAVAIQKEETCTQATSSSSIHKKGDDGDDKSVSMDLRNLKASDVIRRVTAVVVPQIPMLDEITASVWLREINADPWWIAAVICEKQAHLVNAKHTNYIATTLREKSAEKWNCEDLRGYVEFHIQQLINSWNQIAKGGA